MAEIRIPTDRIPADILHRLQAIGHSIIFPGSSSTSSSSPSNTPQPSAAAATAVTTTTTTTNVAAHSAEGPSAIAQAQARSGNLGNQNTQNDAQKILQGNLPTKTQEISPYQALPFVSLCTSQFLTTSTPHPLTAVASSATSSSSSSSLLPTPKSSLSSFPSTSSSPPLLGPFSSPPGPRSGETCSGFPGQLDLFSPHSKMSIQCPDHDETDGQPPQLNQESIVHVLDLNNHRKRGGHPVDESDIVRIFPMSGEEGPGTQGGLEEPDNIQSTAERPTDIVRIFPDEDQESTPLRPTPTKRIHSSPRHSKGGSTKTNIINNNNNNNHHQNNSSSISISQGAPDAVAFSHHQDARLQRSSLVSGPSAASIVPNVLSKPPVFTLGDSDANDITDTLTTPRRRNLMNINVTPNKNKNLAGTDTTPKHQRPDTQSKNSPAYSLTKNARLTPPVSAVARRSPGGLVTPPMTPDEMGEDEVFCYDLSREDSLPMSKRRPFDVYRQTIENTPRRDSPAPSNQRRHSDLSIEMRQLKHAHLYHHHAHSTGSAPPKSSSFSPAQRLSALNFGDRQQTRKRLSFEDCEDEKTSMHNSGSSCGEIAQTFSKNVSNSFSSNHAPSHSAYHSEPALTYYQHQHFNQIRNSDGSSIQYNNGLLESNQPSFNPQHLKPQTLRPRPSKSVSPSLKPRPGASPHLSSQSKDSRAAFNASPHSHAYHQPSPHSPSTSQPIEENHVSSPMRGTVTSHHVVHTSRTLPRGRLHSEGDDVTAEVSNVTPGRLRGQTFSQPKRRRLETTEAASDSNQFVQQQHKQQQQQFQHEQHQQQQLRQQMYQQQQQQHQQQQQQQHQASSPQHQEQPELQHENPNPQHSQMAPTCACATIGRDFLQVAECAYKRIRCLDNSPGDFDRFRREMAQTNDMLKEWLLIMGNIRNICCHAPFTSQPQADTPPVTSIQSTSSKSLPPACSLATSCLPLASSLIPAPTPTLFTQLTASPSSSSAYSTNTSSEQRHQQHHHQQQQPYVPSSSASSSSMTASLSTQLSTLASRDFIDPSGIADEIDDDDDDDDDNLSGFDPSNSVFDRQFLA